MMIVYDAFITGLHVYQSKLCPSRYMHTYNLVQMHLHKHMH